MYLWHNNVLFPKATLLSGGYFFDKIITGQCCWTTWRRARGQGWSPRSSTPAPWPCSSSSSTQGPLSRSIIRQRKNRSRSKCAGAVRQERRSSVQSCWLLWGAIEHLINTDYTKIEIWPCKKYLRNTLPYHLSGHWAQGALWEDPDEESDNWQHVGDVSAGRHVQGTGSSGGD